MNITQIFEYIKTGFRHASFEFVFMKLVPPVFLVACPMLVRGVFGEYRESAEGLFDLMTTVAYVGVPLGIVGFILAGFTFYAIGVTSENYPEVSGSDD